MMNVNDLINSCRLCLAKDRKLFFLFDPLQDRAKGVPIVDKIALCLPIHIKREDRLSKKICGECANKVTDLHRYWNNVVHAQVTLENLAKQMGISVTGYNANYEQASGEHLVIEPDLYRYDFADKSIQVQLIEGENIIKFPERELVKQPRPSLVLEAGESESSENNGAENEPLSLAADDGIVQKEIVKKAGGFTCDYCSKVYQSKFHFLTHVRRHRGERPYKCLEPGCDKAFFTNSNLTTHKKSCHTSERPFACDLCNIKFKALAHLQQHNGRKHNADRKLYECETCMYSTYDYRSLDLHMRRHANNYVCVCDICGKGFYYKPALKEHLAMHNDTTPFVCKICGEQFNNTGKLYYHKKKVHSQKKALPCGKCERVFYYRALRRMHIRREHLGIRYECHECGRIVSSKASMIGHLRTHTDEKPFQCNICQKRFKSRNILKAHRVVHTGEKNYTCEICNKSYSQKSTLNVHNKKVHGYNQDIVVGEDAKVSISREESEFEGGIKSEIKAGSVLN